MAAVTSPSDPTRLRVLTWNVWDCCFVAPRRTDRMRAIAEVLRKGEYDVIGMQEVWMDSTQKLFRAAAAEGGLHFSHSFTAGCSLPARGKGGGLLLLSRYPIVDAHFHRFSTNGQPYQITHWDYQAGKGVGYACVKAPHSNVDVYITHLISQYDDNDCYHSHRTAQAIEASSFMRLSGRSPLTLLLTDLNASDDSLAYKILTQFGRLTDSFKSLHPDDKGLTYGIVGTPFADHDTDNVPGYMCAINRRLDYVLYRARKDVGAQQWQIESCIVDQSDFVVPQGKGGKLLPRSDHYAVSAVFKTVTVSDRVAATVAAAAVAVAERGLPGSSPGGDAAADAELMREARASLHKGYDEAIKRKRLQSNVAIALLLFAAVAAWTADAKLGRAATAAGAEAATYVWCFLPVGFAGLFRLRNERVILGMVALVVSATIFGVGCTLPWAGIAGVGAFLAFFAVPLGVVLACVSIITAADEALGMENALNTTRTQLAGLVAAGKMSPSAMPMSSPRFD